MYVYARIGWTRDREDGVWITSETTRVESLQSQVKIVWPVHLHLSSLGFSHSWNFSTWDFSTLSGVFNFEIEKEGHVIFEEGECFSN